MRLQHTLPHILVPFLFCFLGVLDSRASPLKSEVLPISGLVQNCRLEILSRKGKYGGGVKSPEARAKIDH